MSLRIGVVLYLGTAALFCAVFTQDFVAYDDGSYVTNNPLVKQGVSLTAAWQALTTLNADTSYWHPLTWVSHQLDYALFGSEAGWHKLVNLVLHCHNTVLLYGLLYRIRPNPGCCAAVAALFAGHPLHVESVVWVSERKDVLSTFFGFLAFHCYLDYCAKRSLKGYGLVVLSFACALMSKPMMVTLPALFLLLDFWMIGTRMSRFDTPVGSLHLLWEKLPLFLMSVGVGIVTLVAQNDLGILASTVELPMAVRVANALESYWFYAAKTFVPLGLAVRYPYPTEFPAFSVCLTLVFFVGVSVLAYENRDRRPYFAFGWAWYVISLLPVIGLIQAGMQGRADRYTYLSLIGLFVVIVWGLDDLIVRCRHIVFGFVSAVALVVYLPLTWLQIGFWKDSCTLFRRAVTVTEGNVLMHRALAENLDWNREAEEAWYHYQRAMECPRVDGAVFKSVARFFRARGNLEREVTYLHRALLWAPQQPGILNRLAYIRATHPDLEVRDASWSVELARLACRYDDSSTALYQHTLAAALAASGDFREAVRVAEAALQSGRGATGGEFQRRTELYRQGLPFRDLSLPRRKQEKSDFDQ